MVSLVSTQDSGQGDPGDGVGNVSGGRIGGPGGEISAGGGRGSGEGDGWSGEATVRGFLGSGAQPLRDWGRLAGFWGFVRGRPEVGCAQRPLLVSSRPANGLASSWYFEKRGVRSFEGVHVGVRPAGRCRQRPLRVRSQLTNGLASSLYF